MLGFRSITLPSFGIADNSRVKGGCACSELGTCLSSSATCNCDASGKMDYGYVTDSDVLPLVGFNGHVAPGGAARLYLTDVRCAPSSVG